MGEQDSNWKDFFEHAALTDIGLRRSNNQDSHAVVLGSDAREWQERGHLFMVADGMGAHAAGELASKMACNGIPHTYHKLRDRRPAEALRQAVCDANANIHERGQANADFMGMGTTCSVLLLLPQGAVTAQVGDSRVYRFRQQQLQQLTFDHSLVWEMMAAGQMVQGDTASFVPKNIITRSLGPHAQVQVDLEGPFPLEVGDTFLLCSDGLTGQVSDEEIGLILQTLSPQEAVQVLVDLANLRGGPDNITVIVLRVVQPIAQEGSPSSVPSTTAPPHAGWWVALGVCLLLALVMVLSGRVIFALTSAVGAIIAAAVVLWKHAVRYSSPPAPGGPYGTGPHTERQCVPNASSVAVFAQVVDQLREAAVDEHWPLDWNCINGYKQRAAAAAAAANFATAVREYCLAISFMMSEIRQHRSRDSDSIGRSGANS